jgi:HD-like signal output (HDOD) protein
MMHKPMHNAINSSSDKSGQHVPETARERLLAQIKEDKGLPTLGAAISKVVEITSSGEDSVAELAHFVLSDIGLTQKILRLSNTIHYRTAASVPVTTISRAIFLLGFNAVKTSATAMLLVDCFKDKKQAQSVRRELVHALCASIMARELSQLSKFSDTEEVAVAALFKNIGRVLVASFEHPLYMQIQRQQALDPGMADVAVKTLLGCSYERFGEAVLQEWKIPETIIQALAPLPGGELKKTEHRSDWLKQVASFSDALADMLVSGDQQFSAKTMSQRCEPLLKRFGKALELGQSQLEQILLRVEKETRELANSMDLAMPSVSFSDAPIEAPIDTPDADPLSEFLLQSFDSDQVQEVTRYPSGKPTNARDLLLAGVQDVTQMLASDQSKLSDLILLVLETLYSSMGFRFATACLRDVQNARYMSRVSIGEHYAELQKEFVFSAQAENTIFHLAMNNNADLMISDATVPKIQNMLPLWHKKLLPDTRSFIVLPLVVQQKPLGFFYADRIVTADEGVPPDETALIKTLKSQLVAAMVRR